MNYFWYFFFHWLVGFCLFEGGVVWGYYMHKRWGDHETWGDK